MCSYLSGEIMSRPYYLILHIEYLSEAIAEIRNGLNVFGFLRIQRLMPSADPESGSLEGI